MNGNKLLLLALIINRKHMVHVGKAFINYCFCSRFLGSSKEQLLFLNKIYNNKTYNVFGVVQRSLI